MVTVIVASFLAFVIWRIKKPVLQQKKGATRTSSAAANAPSNGTGATPWKFEEAWKRHGKKALALGAVLLGLAAALWLTPETAAGIWTDYWTKIIVFFAVVLLLVFLIDETKYFKKAKIVAGVVIGIVVASWILVWWDNRPPTFDGPSNTQTRATACTPATWCALTENEDGSTRVVNVPSGKVPCFESWIWELDDGEFANLGFTVFRETERLGRPFPCSIDEVFAGSCRAIYDRFQFNPKEETDLPDYWFVPSGSKQCSA